MAKKIWVPKELFDLVQREAEKEGKTPEELVCEIVMKHVKGERK